MKSYKNISKVSGVDSYEFGSDYSYITVKFKTGEIYTYLAKDNSVDQIRSLSVFAELGVGLNRYLTANRPTYVKGIWVAGEDPLANQRVDQQTSNSLNINKVKYPLGGIDKVSWNNGRDWVTIKNTDGSSATYTVDSCGKRAVVGLIEAAVKGYGLKQLLIDLKPTPVEKLIPDM